MAKHPKATFTRRHFERYLRNRWKEKNFKLKRGERIGVSISELVEHSARRNAKVRAPHLDLWVAVLDEFLSWQLSLLTVVYAERKVGSLTNFDRSVIVILMKIFADSLAMRHLI
jgi:hypothetical protein